jgi:phage terminase large subunit-like protein
MDASVVVQQYIDDVVTGHKPACKWVRLAVERHVRDLETGHERGLRFDSESGAHIIEFFGFLKHSKGEWAGQTITLEPWQQFLLWVLFGWMHTAPETGIESRRFRTAYIEVARKNGKSTLASGIGIYLLDADGEAGAEVYSAATKRDQARITHAEATRMVKSSPFLRRRLRVVKDNIHIVDTASKFEPLGRDTDSMDGLNVHGAIIDEVHAHKNRETWDLLATAMGSRQQPMQIGITTAGYDRHSLCYELHEYGEKVLQQVVEDDTFFAIIFTIDEEDDWEDEACWVKANPNLGVSKKLSYMRKQAREAKEIPSSQNSFLRRDLNVWTQAVTKWMSADKWRACGQAVDGEGLRGRICYGGLDLASTTDIAAHVLIFPPASKGDPFQALCRFYVPEESMKLRSKRDRVPYEAWVRQGYIKATPGDVIDYDFILADIEEDAERYDLREIAYDRWGATQMSQDLRERGFEVVEFGQGFASMSPAMKALERLVLAGELAHGGNPVLTWMADNLVARQDPAGNIKPDKERSTEKIDGMVALIMGLDRAIRNGGKPRESVYETRGIRTL